MLFKYLHLIYINLIQFAAFPCLLLDSLFSDEAKNIPMVFGRTFRFLEHNQALEGDR